MARRAPDPPGQDRRTADGHHGHGRVRHLRVLTGAVLLLVVTGILLVYRPWHRVPRPVFPIGVWEQNPEANAGNYARIGITQFIGLYRGPRPGSLAALAAADLHAVTDGQSPRVLADPHATAISGWLLPDEPDNAQPDGGGGFGPCVPPVQLHRQYQRLKAHDRTRPVVLNLGRGVADVDWVGRGSCLGRTSMYRQYARSADILSFDVYPVNEGLPLGIIARGVDNLRAWGHGKPVWFDVETTSIQGAAGPTPAQVKAETWLAIIHGATGITYFCHVFRPAFAEAGCLRDKTMASALKAQDAQIQSLAPVLLDSGGPIGTPVRSSERVDTMAKRTGGETYLFAVAPETAAAEATFTVPGTGTGTVRVLGENRTVPLRNGTFTDFFPAYGTHLYEIDDEPVRSIAP